MTQIEAGQGTRHFFAHPLALVESPDIGANTRVWAFAHVMQGARIGSDCNIGEQCFIESGATLGDNVTVKNGVAVWSGITVEDSVFLGPDCVLTNDFNPRAYIKKDKDALHTTRIGTHATIGANATIVCGVTIGRYAFVGAGAVVTHSIPDFGLVVGNPARQTGWMCVCAEKLPICADAPLGQSCTCRYCRQEFQRSRSGLSMLEKKTPEVVSHHTSAPEIRVPFVDLKAQYATICNEVDVAMEGVIQSANFVGGPQLDSFESAFAAFTGAKYAVGVGNGTDALTLALQAGGLQPGDEVLVPANSFFASAEAVSNAGGTPVFVDVDPVTFHLDPEAALRAMGPRTRAILPVHLYGRAVDVAPFEALALAHGLFIVEDCAQAHGVHGVGVSGRLSCFSFYPGKNLGAYGDGGAITTSDPDLYARLRMLRDHGSPKKYQHMLIGHNSRLDTIQAAVLSAKLPHLHSWNAKRRDHARKYCAALAGSAIVAPDLPSGNKHVFHLFVVRCSQRDRLQQFLSERNIATGIHYPHPLHLTPAYQALGAHGAGSHPVAEALAGEILSLPMYPELSEVQIQHVTESLTDFIRMERPAPPIEVIATQPA